MSIDLRAVRAWGVEHGQCAGTGKLPNRVVEAWMAAHQVEPDDQPEPDMDPPTFIVTIEVPGVPEWEEQMSQAVADLLGLVHAVAGVQLAARVRSALGGE